MNDASSARCSFYAFVESIERLASDVPLDSLSPAIASLMEARQASRLPSPTHLVWLDCIDQDFFDALPWKGTKIEINAPIEGERRRRELLDIPEKHLRVVLLPLESHDQTGILGEFRTTAWHRVEVGGSEGSPSTLGADFESAIEGPFQVELLRHQESYHGNALSPFISTFNLDFIEDMRFDEDSSGRAQSILPPVPPAAPSAAEDAQQEAIDRWLVEKLRQEAQGQAGLIAKGG